MQIPLDYTGTNVLFLHGNLLELPHFLSITTETDIEMELK